MKVFKWSVRDGLITLILWTVGFCGTVALIIVLFPSLDELIESYTRDASLVLAMMGKDAPFLQDKSLFDIWMTLELFTWWGLFLSAYVAIFAAGAVSGEVEGHTMELMLAQPLSRREVFLGKFVALMFNLAVLGAAVFGTIWLMKQLMIDEKASFNIYGWIFFNNAVMLFAVTGFAFLVSVLTDEPRKVMGITLGVLLFSFLINITVTAAGKMKFLGRLTPFYYCDASRIFHLHGVQWSHIATLFLAGLVLMIAALIAFDRKDIKG